MTLRLQSSLQSEGLARLTLQQIVTMFPDDETVEMADLAPYVTGALERLEHCFSHIDNKYFFNGRGAVFDHLHGDQYAMWLYLLSNELFKNGGLVSVCKKLFLLNKALHGCDIFYEVALPSVFLLVHPLGTVLGRGIYSDFLIVYQRVGIGSNHDVYPILGRHLTLHPGSAVLGRAVIGDHCCIASESLVLDRDLPPNSLYIGNPRDHLVKQRTNLSSMWRK